MSTRPAHGHSISRNAAYGLATQLSSAALTAALTLYLVRALKPVDYGLFALALSVGALAVLPSDFGISSSTARFLAERRGQAAAAAAVARTALRLRLATAVPVALALLALASPIAAAYGQPGLAAPLRAMAVVLLGQSVMLLCRGSFVALGRTDLSLWMTLLESVAEVAASVAFVALGGAAAGAALGRAAGYVVGGLIGVVLLVRLLGGRVVSLRRAAGSGRGASVVPWRSIARYAGALFVIDGAFTLFEQVDVLLIGGYLGAAAAGVFQAPLRLVTFLHYPGLALATAVAPRMAGDDERRAEVFQQALRIVVVVQAALAAATLAWAGPITELALGPGYGDSAGVLRALSPYVLLSGVAPLVSLAVNYTGAAGRRVPIALATVALNVAIDVTLIPRIGVVAGAVGTGVAYAIYVGAHLVLCRRILGLRLRPLLVTAVRAALASGALAGGLLLWGRGDLDPFQWIGGGLTAALLFVGVLIATGETSAPELGRLARRARA